MKNILTGVILMVLFVAGNAFAGGGCLDPADPVCNHQVPEPSTLLLLASGAASIGGIALYRWRKK